MHLSSTDYRTNCETCDMPTRACRCFDVIDTLPAPVFCGGDLRTRTPEEERESQKREITIVWLPDRHVPIW